MNITQYYHVHARGDWEDIYEVGGGAQDNGTSIRDINNATSYNKVKGGDGFRYWGGHFDGNDVRYITLQQGKFYVQEDVAVFGWVEDQVNHPDHLDANDDGTGYWDLPWDINPDNVSQITSGYRHLYFNPQVIELEDYERIIVNRPFGPAYGPNALITQIQWAASHSGRFYFYMAGDSMRDLWVVRDFWGARDAGNISSGNCIVYPLDTLLTAGGNITDVDVSPYDAKSVVITIPGYNAAEKVFRNHNIDSAHFWENITYDLPNVPVHCARQTVEGLYIGTDIGVFFLSEDQTTWTYFSDGMPPVPVTKLGKTTTSNRGAELWISTFGRGMWRGEPAEATRRTRWYVDQTASGFESGISWEHAFTDLQDAFDIARPTDSIWIASGSYTPGTSRSSSFTVPYPLISVYGGFSGVEERLEDRDTTLGISVLSGDIGILGDSTDNVYHILELNGNNGWCRFDRLVFYGGQANGSGANSNGGAVYYSNTSGGTGKPLFFDCIFTDNYAYRGAAIYFEDFHYGDPVMPISGCSFFGGRASYGGGVAIETRSAFGETGDASITFAGLRFPQEPWHVWGCDKQQLQLRGGG